MQNVSKLTTNISQIADAITGQWDRHSEKDVLWVIAGRMVFLEGDKSKFPYRVVAWHQIGGLWVAILGTETYESSSGSSSGDVAKKLEIARELMVNLSNRTQTSTFDGSEDQKNIKVSGKLSDENIESAERWNSKQDFIPDLNDIRAAIALFISSSESWNQHLASTTNPHEVTAEQVNTYTKSVIDSKISEAASGQGHFLGSLEPMELNALISAGTVNMNDSADMTRDGTIIWTSAGSQHTLAVEKYDSVILTSSGWVKRTQKRFAILVESGGDTFYVGPV